MSILRADSIRNRAGTGAPDFPNGATVTGVVTATSFSGNITGNITGNVTGNVTGNADTATSATSATSATNAQGLTGTPNITVGTVTGTDATFSGNLTVNGTTTTIDTAVTAVDSLAVDGNITSGGNQTGQIQLGNGSGSGGQKCNMTFTGSGNEFFDIGIKGSNVQYGHIRFNTGTTPTERVRITSGGTAIFKNGLAEKFNNTGGTMSSGTHAIQSGNIIRFTGNESGANALNITGIHSTLADGEALSFTVICTPNNSGYISGFNIDGVTPATSIYWSGGSAPTAGGSSGRDVYTFTVLKTGTGTNAYEVYGAVTNYA